jgi:nicotinamidase-related amidase
MIRVWDNFLTDLDKQVAARAGYGRRGGFGTRPALFIIDVQYNFCGDEPEQPIMDGLDTYRTHCGEAGWRTVPHIERLMKICREKKFPIFYTVSERRSDLLDSGVQVGKSHRGTERTVLAGTHATETVAPIAPRPEDILISKRKPSAFFGTPLMSHLNFLDIDTIVLTGCTTSGCIRATAVDAFAYNFKVVVPEEATFDRFASSHAMSLFDLNCKYADVIGTDEVADKLSAFPAREAFAAPG